MCSITTQRVRMRYLCAIIYCLWIISVDVFALTPTPAQISAAKTNARNAIKAKPTLGPKALRLSEL